MHSHQIAENMGFRSTLTGNLSNATADRLLKVQHCIASQGLALITSQCGNYIVFLDRETKKPIARIFAL